MNINITKIFLSFILSITAGAIPSAFIALRLFNGSDIRNQGSGNVGALNSYEVSHSKWLGLSVLLADLLKSVIALLLCIFALKVHNLKYFNNEILITDAVLLILAHNYNPFLRFKGGKGLTVAAGIFLIINPFLLFVWLLLWFVAYKTIFQDVISTNIFATIAALIAVVFAKSFIIEIFYTFIPVTTFEYKFLAFLISAIILIKHYTEMHKSTVQND